MDACETALEWAKGYDTPDAAWANCEDGLWMMWALEAFNALDPKDAVRLGCQFARRVVHLNPDPACLAAVEAVEAWLAADTEEAQKFAARATEAAKAARAAEAAAESAAESARAAALAAARAAALAATRAATWAAEAAAEAAEAAAGTATWAAGAAAWAAVRAAAWAAAAEADWAAEAAAWAAARTAEMKTQADIIREVIPTPDFYTKGGGCGT